MAAEPSVADRLGLTDATAGDTRLLLLAAAIAVAVLSPVIWLVLRATDIGLERVGSLLVRPTAIEALVNSVALVVVVTAGSILIGVPLAVLVVRTDLPFPRFWTVVVALPIVIPSYIGAFAFISAFGPQGIVADAIGPLAAHIPTIYGFKGAALVLTLFIYPYVFIGTRAALLTFDARLVEAARTLNRGRLEAFREITLPRILPGIAAGALLVALYTLSDFGTPAIMHFDTFTRVIYVEYNTFARDLAALLSIQLLAVTALILAIESRVGADDADAYTSRGRGGAEAIRISLGRWRWPVVLFPALVATLTLVVPLGVLFYWLLESSVTYGAGPTFQWTYGLNSVGLSAAAALLATVAAIPIAYLATQRETWLSTLIERATYVGYAMPGIVLGLALVYFGAAYVPFLYQTIPLLVFAYIVRFLPQSVSTVRSSLLQIDPQLVEAARMLGESPTRAFRRVTLPLVAPGIVAGAALVFLTTMKELPATLMLHPTGFDTIVTYIWLIQASGAYGKAAVPALLLVGLSGLSIFILLYRGDSMPDGDQMPDSDSVPDDQVPDSDSMPDDQPISDGSPRPDRGTTAPDDPILRVEDVSKEYGVEAAVEDLSFAVEDGELLTLLGPSGCGKTTTLRLLAGLEQPTTGTISIAGEQVADPTTSLAPEDRSIGMVFQDFALFPHLTVRENIAFGLSEMSEAAQEARVEELLELVDMPGMGDRSPDQLSGGQQQRVALARSLAPEPDILLLDEPFSNLDVRLRVEMREEVRRILKAAGVTAVSVTHDQEEALSISDRVAVMHDGTVEQIGPPGQVFQHPRSRFVASFLGQAGFLSAEIDEAVHTEIGSFDRDLLAGLEPAYEGADVDVLVRPDDIKVAPATNGDGDGRIVRRQYTGPSYIYHVELDNADTVRCMHKHDDEYPVGERVSVDLVTEHTLAWYPAEQDLGE